MRNLNIFSFSRKFLIFSLMFLTSKLVDAKCKPTTPDIIGPFYIQNVRNYRKFCSTGSSVDQGDRLVVRGRVLNEDCRPLARRRIDMWQANPSGRYLFQDCRGYMYTDGRGYYEFTTIHPGKYPIDRQRRRFRPAHLHFKVFGGTRHNDLVTQMYFAGDSHLGRNDSCRVCNSDHRDLVVRPRVYCDNPDIRGCVEVAVFNIVLSKRPFRFQRIFRELAVLDRALDALSNNLPKEPRGRTSTPIDMNRNRAPGIMPNNLPREHQGRTTTSVQQSKNMQRSEANEEHLKPKDEPMAFNTLTKVVTATDPKVSRNEKLTGESTNDIVPNESPRRIPTGTSFKSRKNNGRKNVLSSFPTGMDLIIQQNLQNRKENSARDSNTIEKSSVEQQMTFIPKNDNNISRNGVNTQDMQNLNTEISIDSLVNAFVIEKDNKQTVKETKVDSKTETPNSKTLQNHNSAPKRVENKQESTESKQITRPTANLSTTGRPIDTRKQETRKPSRFRLPPKISLTQFFNSVFGKLKSIRSSLDTQ